MLVAVAQVQAVVLTGRGLERVLLRQEGGASPPPRWGALPPDPHGPPGGLFLTGAVTGEVYLLPDDVVVRELRKWLTVPSAPWLLRHVNPNLCEGTSFPLMVILREREREGREGRSGGSGGRGEKEGEGGERRKEREGGVGGTEKGFKIK